MGKLIGTIVLIMLVVAALGTLLFEMGKKHPLAEYILTQEVGNFTDISKNTFENYDTYKLYIKTDEGMEEKELIVYKKSSLGKGSVDLEIRTNAMENSYELDFNQNGWLVYANDYKNKIIININNETKINNIKDSKNQTSEK